MNTNAHFHAYTKDTCIHTNVCWLLASELYRINPTRTHTHTHSCVTSQENKLHLWWVSFQFEFSPTKWKGIPPKKAHCVSANSHHAALLVKRSDTLSGVCGCLEVLKGHIYNGSLYKNVRQVISRKKKEYERVLFQRLWRGTITGAHCEEAGIHDSKCAVIEWQLCQVEEREEPKKSVTEEKKVSAWIHFFTSRFSTHDPTWCIISYIYTLRLDCEYEFEY